MHGSRLGRLDHYSVTVAKVAPIIERVVSRMSNAAPQPARRSPRPIPLRWHCNELAERRERPVD